MQVVLAVGRRRSIAELDGLFADLVGQRIRGEIRWNEAVQLDVGSYERQGDDESGQTKRSGTEIFSASPSVLPDAATSSGDGVSPAASAAASGSPPGSAAATDSAVAGRRAGAGSRQRRMTFSTAGSISAAIDDMLVICAFSCSRISSAALAPSYARLPVNTS